MGYPELRIVVVPHPLGGISQDLVLAKAPDAVEVVASYFDQ